MKCLVTGIEGFVGGYLADTLVSSGHDVFGTFFDEKVYSANKRNDCSAIFLDIRRYDRLSKYICAIKPDVVFHLAAQSSVADSWKHPGLTMDINVNGTVNILEAIRNESKNSRLLIVGSSEEYGFVAEDENPINELHPLVPVNPYAVSKVTAEEMGRVYSHAYALDILFARSFNHIGPGQSTRFAIADFAHRIAMISLKKMEPAMKTGNLDAKRDFTDVRDVVSAYLLLAANGRKGEIYNVGRGESHSIGECLEHMVCRENLSIDISIDPTRMRPSDVPDIYCDNKKITSLGWKPMDALYETIDDMIDYNKKIEGVG